MHRLEGHEGGIEPLNALLQGEGFVLNGEGGVTKARCWRWRLWPGVPAGCFGGWVGTRSGGPRSWAALHMRTHTLPRPCRPSVPPQVSPDGLLLQSATVADRVSFCFAGGETQLVPGAYIELAERRLLPQFAHLQVSVRVCCGSASTAPWSAAPHCTPASPNVQPGEVGEEHRRDGFEAASADRIFESTTLASQQRPQE